MSRTVTLPLLLVLVLAPLLARALSTAFTYQGRLTQAGAAPTGTYDFDFALYDAAAGGAQVGGTVSKYGVAVANGLFTVALDFGAAFDGADRWLAIAARAVGGGSYVPLAPRQPLTATPYALVAKAVEWADIHSRPNIWLQGGNAFAAAGVLGTADNQALEFRVNAARALRLEPSLVVPNLIGGSDVNGVAVDRYGAVICGGGYGGSPNTINGNWGAIVGGYLNAVAGSSGFIGAGTGNTVSAAYGAVAGGHANTAGGTAAAIAGGENNSTTAGYAAIAGGKDNAVNALFGAVAGGTYNTVTGDATRGAIGGGENNTVGGSRGAIAGGAFNTIAYEGSYGAIGGGYGNQVTGAYGAVPGGYACTAGNYAFAAGNRAKATQAGAFVWGDSQGADLTAPGTNTVTVRAFGGIWLGTTSTPSIPAGRFLNTSTGGYLSSTGTWTNSCDRNLKTAFASIDSADLLQKLAALPITAWRYKAGTGERHIGPMAQDFYATFGLGLDDVGISTVDGIGVALAAAQALQAKVARLEAANAALQAKVAEVDQLRADLAKLEAAVTRMAGNR